MTTQKQTMEEYRCICGKMLFKAEISFGLVEIKCRRCAKINLFEHPSQARRKLLKETIVAVQSKYE